MVDKCRKCGVKNILMSSLVFTTSIVRSVGKIHETRSTFCAGHGLI